MVFRLPPRTCGEGWGGVFYCFARGLLEGFTIDGDLWHLTQRRSGDSGHSSPDSMYYGDENQGNFDIGDSAGSITSPAIDLTGATQPKVVFNYFLETEGSYGTYDVAKVLVSADGVNYNPLNSYLIDTDGTWNQLGFNLSDYVGQTINLRFAFDSGDDNFNDYEGWYVDDVSVQENETPTDIELDNNTVLENEEPGTLVGILTTVDSDGDENFTYTLVPGFGDNASFVIVEDQLQTAAAFDYEAQNEYSIKVQTDNGFGGTYLEEFTIYVNDVPFDGDDDLYGTPKNDTIDGSRGNDTIRGAGGNDLLIGAEDNDKLVGGLGNDALKGELGNDFLFGGNGVDELTGGSGRDILTGNNGADKFIFSSPTNGIDVIKDFRGAQQGDRIVLNTSNFEALDPDSFSADNFVKGNKALDGDDYLIYNNSNNIPNGHLFYDPDGVGGENQVKIAVLIDAPMLSANYFELI